MARERQGVAVRLLAEASLAELADWSAAEKVATQPPQGSRRAVFRVLDPELRLVPLLPLIEEPPVQRLSAWGGSADRFTKETRPEGRGFPFSGDAPRCGGQRMCQRM